MGRNLLGLSEGGQRLLLVAEGRMRAGQPKRGIEIMRIGGLYLLQKRDGFHVLRSPEQTRGLVENREEGSHVGGTRSILTHGRLHVGCYVAETGQLLPLLIR